MDRGLPFEGDEEKKESSKMNKDTVFNIEDMMTPSNDSTFDFLNVKVAPVDQVTADVAEENATDDAKGMKKNKAQIGSMLMLTLIIIYRSSRSGRVTAYHVTSSKGSCT